MRSNMPIMTMYGCVFPFVATRSHSRLASLSKRGEQNSVQPLIGNWRGRKRGGRGRRRRGEKEAEGEVKEKMGI